MSTAMAFLSGKGGSGKTTLALSMADLLCRCDIKTLLIDCDLSTNGATYFYETQLNEWNGGSTAKVLSFCDVLNGNDDPMLYPLEVKPQLDFIPSVPEISGKYLTRIKQNELEAWHHLCKFVDLVKQRYDVVLFDCQAGYSEFLPALLPQMDADLFVLEADNISASAMRSLHLKIGDHLGRAHLYQIFNKATEEEFETYSKIVGTFFTNIGTLLFDWKIRQAFSRSQIPDLENTSEQYGWDLCNVCQVIFRDEFAQEGLEHFSERIQYRRLKKKKAQKEFELKVLQSKRSFEPKIAVIVLMSIILFGGALLIISEGGLNQKLYSILTNSMLTSAPLIITIIPMILMLIDKKSDRLEEKKQRWKYEQELEDIEEALLKLDKQLVKSDRS